MKVKDALTTVGLTKYPERLRITKIEKLRLTSPFCCASRHYYTSLCCEPFVTSYQAAVHNGVHYVHYVRVQRVASL